MFGDAIALVFRVSVIFVISAMAQIYVAKADTRSTTTAATSKPIVIYSKGVRLAGDLWTPPGADGTGEKRPAMLLIHGWGGLKAQLNQTYAPVFAAKGYYVLTFDFRGWGESDGDLLPVGPLPEQRSNTFTMEVQEVREVVNPINQYDDIRAALLYLQGERGVDRNRIAVWGSSLGGGLALKTAILNPEIKVLINQIGSVNHHDNYLKLEKTSPAHPNNVHLWRQAIARGDAPSVPGPSSKVGNLKGFADHPELLRYVPLHGVEKLRAATLIIDAKDEELFDIRQNGELLYNKIKDQTPTRYEVLEGSHYDLYSGDGAKQAIALQLEWMAQHLPIK